MGCASEKNAAIGARAQPILGGKLATTAEYFGTVALLEQGATMCTGTLIAPTVVVTAAHCVVITDDATGEIKGVLQAQDLTVVAGALQVAGAPADKRFGVRSVIPHPAYPGPSTADPEGLGRDEDIALLLLRSPVAALQPVALLSSAELDAALTPNTPLTISGYGALSAQGAVSGKLYLAETPYKRRNAKELIAGAKGKPDTCPGDSGGPAYLMRDGVPALVGATSRASALASDSCGDGGIYTLVPAYGAWMKESSQGEYPPMSGAGGSGGAGSAGGGAGPSDAPAPDAPAESSSGGCVISAGSHAWPPVAALAPLACVAARASRRRRRRAG
jgi:secreted trypsin-like serine protease